MTFSGLHPYRHNKPTGARGWHAHGSTMSELMHGTVRSCISEANPDIAVNIESHFINTVLECDDAATYDLDIGTELWLNASRWTRLTREYIDAHRLEVFINGAREIYSGNARGGACVDMLFRDPDRYAKKHRWGGCLMSATFMLNAENRPTLTFNSRTTYMGYMGLMDAGIAALVAREISQDNNQKIRFIWQLGSMQLHAFKTLPFLFSQPDLLKKLKYWSKFYKRKNIAPKDFKVKYPGASPTWFFMAKWYLKILDHFNEHGVGMLDVEKYGPLKRIKRRWLEHEGHLDKNIPPSLMIGDLDFSKCEVHNDR